MSWCKIKDLILEERPREKLITYGSEFLTDVELLALVLGTGGKKISSLDLARTLIKDYGKLENVLKSDIEKLINYKHIGKAKAVALKAIEQITERHISFEAEPGYQIRSPSDIYRYLRKDLKDKDQEHIYVLCLNSCNKVISKNLISIGTNKEALLSGREVYIKALEKGASSIALVHNHPTGSLEASPDDIATTQKIAEIGQYLNLPLLDHLIIGKNDFFSMKMAGLLNLDRKEVSKYTKKS